MEARGIQPVLCHSLALNRDDLGERWCPRAHPGPRQKHPQPAVLAEAVVFISEKFGDGTVLPFLAFPFLSLPYFSFLFLK